MWKIGGDFLLIPADYIGQEDGQTRVELGLSLYLRIVHNLLTNFRRVFFSGI